MKYIGLFCALFLAYPVLAQVRTVSKPKIAIKVHNYGDSIVLRWGVSEAADWLDANQKGYILERLEYQKGNPTPYRRMMSALPIKPLSLEQMKIRLQRDDPNAAVAAQMLYGKGYKQQPANAAAGYYEMYQEQQSRLLIITKAAEFSPSVASAVGLRWVDKAMSDKATRYEYRLWINHGSNPKETDLRDTAKVTVIPFFKDELYAPTTEGIEIGDGALKIKWQKGHVKGSFSGFYIERSNDKRQFSRLNKVPFVMSKPDSAEKDIDPNEVFYIDSVKANYQKFYYRIAGINAFGDVGPFSDTLMGIAKDLTPPKAPINLVKKVEDNRRIVLNWEMKMPIAPDLKGFIVARAGDIEGNYQRLTKDLLPPAARSFVDFNPVAYRGRYYKVAAIDTAGNIAYTLPIAATIEDLTPPVPPKGMTVAVDTNGVATIKWPIHPEGDVLGYKLYRAYEKDASSYLQITPSTISDTIAIDTLPTRSLTRTAYYKLVAIDLSNNHSAFSEAIAVAIPDKVPPSAPVIRSVVTNRKFLQINVIPSASLDVAGYQLYRKEREGGLKLIKQIRGFKPEEFVISDSSVVNRAEYEYVVNAIDARGLVSKPSFAVPVVFNDVSVLKIDTPTNLTARYDAQQKGIRIEWRQPSTAEKHHFVLYRGVNGEPISMYKAVSGQSFFVDTNLSQEGAYVYAVRAVSEEKQSTLSQSVTTNYKK